MTSSLLETRLGDIIKDQWLVSLEPHHYIVDGLAKLAHNHILCAPVMESTSPSTEKKKEDKGVTSTILGFVDVLDMLAFLVKQCTKTLTDVKTGESRSLTSDDIAMMRKRTKDFKMANVTEVINFSKRDPAYCVNLNHTVGDAVNIYLKGAHRIAIIDDKGTPIGLVSQCGILEKITEKKGDDILRQMERTKVKDTQFMHKDESVVCVKKDDITIDAFLMMHAKTLSNVGVVDESGKIIGVLSASDLKNLTEGDFQCLLDPVEKFIGDIRKQQGKKSDFCVVATKDETIFDITRKMVDNKVHRVFIVDTYETMKPIGVISMTDVLRGSVKRAPTTA